MSNTVNNYTETDLGNISLNPRGEYDNSAAYEYLDTVSYQGGSYFCLAELETTITGIAPDAGRNSEHWQMIAAPGDMTPEYTAAYNDVINKAVQVETSRAAVELAQQEIEAVQTDVQQLHSDTVQAAQEAENSKNSAANSAQSAEQSRKTVSESEQNINGQIVGFDSRVSEAVEQSKEEINTTKQQAIDTITNQQNTSVNTVKTEGEKIITRVGNDAKTVADDRATVEEAAQTVLNNAQEVAQNTQTVASNMKNAAASAESAKNSADNAVQSAKSVEDASKQIEQNKKDVASLKEDISTKITKFYASSQGETHLADSDNGKIMDMMLYGKSEQKQYTGYQLLNDIFEKGSIDVNTGELVESDSNLRTKFFSKIEAGKEYHIELPKDVTIAFRYYADENTYISSYAASNSTRFSTPESATLLKAVLINNNIYSNNILLSDVMDRYIYEPYTGGIPSPNPDYPQEIKSVVNPTVKVCGKNLWSGQNTENYWMGNNATENTECVSSDYIPIKGSQTIYAGFSYDWFVGFSCYDLKKNKILGSEQQINSTQENIENEYKIVPSKVKTPENTAFIKMMFSRHESKPYVSIVDGKYELYHEQTVTLPYTLNAIPVSSGGNVTIDGQQYIADYVDVERGKIIKNVVRKTFNTRNGNINEEYRLALPIIDDITANDGGAECIFSTFEWASWTTFVAGSMVYVKNIKKSNDELYTAQELKELSFDFDVIYQLSEKQETDLTTEQVQALKELSTYYPVTNITVGSEQLYGYTAFNYPISMKNGWNYVKQQLNDNRDYIYDMDLQSAEAYVNSEYAVALTELEV